MQRNIMAIDNFYGIAAGKNFVIYSFLSKHNADVFRKELSLGFILQILELVFLTSFVR